MEEVTRLSATVISRTGMLYARNEESFYLGGQFTGEHDVESIQTSFQGISDEFVFAVGSGMNIRSADRIASVNFNEEFRRIDQINRTGNRDIKKKFQHLCESALGLASIVRNTRSSSDTPDNLRNTAIAGLLMFEGELMAFAAGEIRITLVRDNQVRLLTPDPDKYEEDEEDQDNSTFGLRRSDVLTVRDGDMFVLCTRGAAEAVNAELMRSLAAKNESTDITANRIVDAARRSNSNDNITAMVIRVEEAACDSAVRKAVNINNINKDNDNDDDDDELEIPLRRNVHARRRSDYDDDERIDEDEDVYISDGSPFKRFMTTTLICIAIAALIFAAYKLWVGSSQDISDIGVVAPTSQSATDGESTSESTSGSTSEPDATDTDDDDDITASPSPDAPKTTPSTKMTNYTVKAGDSLMKIAEQFYGDPSKYKIIMDANDISDENRIIVGQVLKIPKE